MTRRHDWTTIRREYVEAPSEKERPTYEQLAQKYDVSIGYLRQRASREKWAEQANKHLTNIERSRRKKLIEERSRQLARIDSAKLNIAEALFKMIGDKLYQMQSADPQKFLKPYEISHYAQSLAILSDLCDRARGDEFTAIQLLADRGILTESHCHQIAQVMGESEESVSEAIAKILRGQGEYPD
ncbi:MAG: hypothetical protein J7647_32100 [Cyanobacteria bacterium SBLK]|nr:hypothetical protein [Cyanobacteria bacterium SBLK]